MRSGARALFAAAGVSATNSSKSSGFAPNFSIICCLCCGVKNFARLLDKSAFLVCSSTITLNHARPFAPKSVTTPVKVFSISLRENFIPPPTAQMPFTTPPLAIVSAKTLN
jgi:hypothetical protein